MGASGSMNYAANSGSWYSAAQVLNQSTVSKYLFRKTQENYQKPATTTTIPGSLTVEYFQRVYDAGTAGWCYYTKTSIDATPSAGETTPNYTGAISNHSVVQILEIY
jgi:hypothetical protein